MIGRAVRGCTLLLLLLGIAPPAAAETRRHAYLILPFEDRAPDPSRDWLREAMAASLGDYYLFAGQAVVGREDRILAMEEVSVPAGAPLTLATSIKLGRHFAADPDGPRADRLVVGRFNLDQGQIVVSARVINLDSNRAAPWKEERGSLKDLLRLLRSLAHSLFRSDGISGNNLAAAADDAGARRDFPLVAYENYIRALVDSSSGRQPSLLRKALEQSPGYPKASFQLGRLLAKQGKLREAEDVLRKSSGEPVPYAGEYHALLGSLSLDGGRLSEAEAEAAKALASKETAEGRVLMARIARAQGDLESARKELDRAAVLDPENPDIDVVRRQIEGNPAPRR
jgi:tetratricopeptide repeat protein